MAAPGDPALTRLARRIARRLRAQGTRIVTAESCTGGFLAKCLTDLPGSSDYYDRGWITYSDTAKQELLRVSGQLLGRHGAVSESVARAMVRGTLRLTQASIAVAVTGIAGPSGGTAGKPVGTVWIAWGRRSRGRLHLVSRRFRFRGDRDAVRRRTVAAALRGLLRP